MRPIGWLLDFETRPTAYAYKSAIGVVLMNGRITQLSGHAPLRACKKKDT